MDHRNAQVYNAIDGEYVTLEGRAYIGSYYVKSSGILMTTPTKLLKSEVIVSTKGRKTKTSQPIGNPEPNTEHNENLTQYDLLPVLYNDPPVILSAINEASDPQIKPSAAVGTLPPGNYMYQFPDGPVKVHTGTNIKLQVEAQQPPILNVENGQLQIIDANKGLTYTWLVDGERVPLNDNEKSLSASRTISGSQLIITNMIPRFAGNYTCLVNNDIGSTDGGSVLLDVYNSTVDSYFYTNLIKNPNGTLEDGSLGSSGWEALNGAMEPKDFTARTIGARDKKIEINIMTPVFNWTQEMMNPRPYQLSSGIMQNNPLKNIKSYFTREKYQYELNGGIDVAQMYQDIDLSDLTDHIRGAIYGVSGVAAIISFYLGNALWTYEPAYPLISPTDVIDSANYNQGAARISLENFAKMGPGFIREHADVTIEEYRDNQLLPTNAGGDSIITRDPWNQSLKQQGDNVYYPGGMGYLESPDEPSLGDERDKVLFAADTLMPNQNDRFTYGQYAKFNKIVIPKLNPLTSKIRIIFTIKAQGNLSTILSSINPEEVKTSTDGIYYLKNWATSWFSGTMAPRLGNLSWDDIHKPFNYLKANYRVSEPWPENMEQRVPKQSTSRALATGFNVTLVPDESDRGIDNSVDIISMQSQNTSVKGLVPTPINQSLASNVFNKLEN